MWHWAPIIPQVLQLSMLTCEPNKIKFLAVGFAFISSIIFLLIEGPCSKASPAPIYISTWSPTISHSLLLVKVLTPLSGSIGWVTLITHEVVAGYGLELGKSGFSFSLRCSWYTGGPLIWQRREASLISLCDIPPPSFFIDTTQSCIGVAVFNEA